MTNRLAHKTLVKALCAFALALSPATLVAQTPVVSKKIAAENKQPAAVDNDRMALIGTWKITQYQDDGADRMSRLGVNSSPTKKGQPDRIAKLVITADECWVIRADGKRDKLAGLTNCGWKSSALDPAHDPQRCDIGGFKGKDGSETIVYPGIYHVEGNQLKICWIETGIGKNLDAVRPAKFESDAHANLFVCERLSKLPEQIKE